MSSSLGIKSGLKVNPLDLDLAHFFPCSPLFSCSSSSVHTWSVVRRDITASLILECTVEAIPPVTFVEIRRRYEDGDVLLSTMSGSSQMLILQYTLGNLMVNQNDSGVYVCVASNPIGLSEQSFTLVVQGEWLLNRMQASPQYDDHYSGIALCDPDFSQLVLCSLLVYSHLRVAHIAGKNTMLQSC